MVIEDIQQKAQRLYDTTLCCCDTKLNYKKAHSYILFSLLFHK